MPDDLLTPLPRQDFFQLDDLKVGTTLCQLDKEPRRQAASLKVRILKHHRNLYTATDFLKKTHQLGASEGDDAGSGDHHPVCAQALRVSRESRGRTN